MNDKTTKVRKEENAEESIRKKIDEYILNHREEIVSRGISVMNHRDTLAFWLRGISGKAEDMTLSIGFYAKGFFKNQINIEDSIVILCIDESSDMKNVFSEKNRLGKGALRDILFRYLGSAAHDAFLNDSIEKYLDRLQWSA